MQIPGHALPLAQDGQFGLPLLGGLQLGLGGLQFGDQFPALLARPGQVVDVQHKHHDRGPNRLRAQEQGDIQLGSAPSRVGGKQDPAHKKRGDDAEPGWQQAEHLPDVGKDYPEHAGHQPVLDQPQGQVGGKVQEQAVPGQGPLLARDHEPEVDAHLHHEQDGGHDLGPAQGAAPIPQDPDQGPYQRSQGQGVEKEHKAAILLGRQRKTIVGCHRVLDSCQQSIAQNPRIEQFTPLVPSGTAGPRRWPPRRCRLPSPAGWTTGPG